MNIFNPILVGNYCLEPLLEIRQDDISTLLGSYPGVYICENQTKAWHQHFCFDESPDIRHSQKKIRMFSKMGCGSMWLSPISATPNGKKTKKWEKDKIIYYGYRALPFRFDQIFQTISMLIWLMRNRSAYHYCLVYNFDLPFYLAPLAIKYLLRKPLFVDYEDDYSIHNSTLRRKFIEKIIRNTASGAICVNACMKRYFPNKNTRVFNAFADLSYAKNLDYTLRDGMAFLYSGALDEIRGIEFIPDLIMALKQHIKYFKIIITGDGSLRKLVQSWNYPEVDYLGFLDNVSYVEVLKSADACLILQKPDHPFNAGSFPSKVDEYAEYLKPIFILRKNSRE